MITNGYKSRGAIEREICMDFIHIYRRLSDLEKRIDDHAKHYNIPLGPQIQFRRELNQILIKCDRIGDLLTKIDKCQGKLKRWGYEE